MPPTDLIAFNRKKPVEQWPLLSPLSSPKFPLPNNVEAISGPRFHQTIAVDIFSRGPPHLCPPGLVDTPSERRPSMFSGHRWLQQPHQHPQHQQQQSLTCASVYANCACFSPSSVCTSNHCHLETFRSMSDNSYFNRGRIAAALRPMFLTVILRRLLF